MLPVFLSQVRGQGGISIRMGRFSEIEQALRELPPGVRLEIGRWLLEDLQERTVAGNDSGNGGEPAGPLPDYAARRRRIFGGKVLPNMVLAGRAEER
jgi:hypothetical protein